jgi:hypothetical protein
VRAAHVNVPCIFDVHEFLRHPTVLFTKSARYNAATQIKYC